MSRDSADRKLGFLPPAMDNGSNSRMMFHHESRPSFGSFMEDSKLFQNQEAALRRSLYASPGRIERGEGNVEGDGDGSDEDDDEEDDEVEDDELDEGDGEIEGLVSADLGNKNSNNSSGSVQSSSEKICSEKDEHRSCFGLSRTVMSKCGNEMRGNSDAITVVEPELYCSQIFQGGNGSNSTQKALGGVNGCGFGGRREFVFPVYPGESLRAHLSDPLTGILMDDAIILPCGHSFGSGGMQHVQRMKACFKCSLPISEDSVRPNLALRAAVQAFLREEESHSSRLFKRRRDRFEQDKYNYDDQLAMDSRSRGVQFPFNVSDRVIIKGNKRTPQRFVGRMAVVTTQCLNGWYVVKTLDNAESVKLQYRSLAKVPEDSSNFTGNKSISSNWL